MKILIPITGKGFGGSYGTGAVMVEALAAAGHHVVVCLPWGAKSIRYFSGRDVEIIRYHFPSDLNLRRYRGLSRLHHTLLQWCIKYYMNNWIERFRPDIIHFNDVSSAKLAIGNSKLCIPSVTHVRDFRRGRKEKIPLSDAFIYISQAVKAESFQSGYRDAKDVVIYDPPDHRRFKIPVDSKRVLREARGLNVSEIVIGYVGFLVHRKRPEWLIEAVARLRSDGYAVRACYLGEDLRDNGMRATLEHRSCELGIREYVTFAGHHKDVAEWISAFDILISCGMRYGEAYGLTLVEAGLLGVPVVATEGTGATEVMPESCLTSAPSDFDAFVANLKELVGNPEKRKRAATMARAEVEKLSLAGLASELEAVYDSIRKP